MRKIFRYMRVILKPVGLLSIVITFAALAWIIVSQSRNSETKTIVAAGVTVAPSPSPEAGRTLQNGDFESRFVPVVVYSDVGTATGTVASPWADDSSWAPVSVDYSQETQNPHGGTGCQKVVVREVATGKEARVQFVQDVNLAQNKKYRATCWIRAEQATAIDFSLRQKPWPYTYCGVNKVTVGQEWKQITVTGTPHAGGNSLVMFKVSKPVTFWVDDVSIEALSTANP